MNNLPATLKHILAIQFLCSLFYYKCLSRVVALLLLVKHYIILSVFIIQNLITFLKNEENQINFFTIWQFLLSPSSSWVLELFSCGDDDNWVSRCKRVKYSFLVFWRTICTLCWLLTICWLTMEMSSKVFCHFFQFTDSDLPCFVEFWTFRTIYLYVKEFALLTK